MKGQKRDPMMVLVLSLITCGIYGIIWLFNTTEELKKALPKDDLNPGLDILLGIVTCGIYFIWAIYRNGQLITELQGKVGLEKKDQSVVGLLLALFGLFFVAAMIYQTELNKIWEKMP